ncbi:adenosine deaminase [Methanomicrobiaceae archaeon CYW5]|uniref:adenine deaminase n=1 Tax=Methanovulcanius yangii TaxID=1789227 RepID=UPI0029CA8FFF|nr:adenine deaminase [Methanovulcanius yangii]MBT8507776.1 adenosine deaminase [Methanovulcanius yangii]
MRSLLETALGNEAGDIFFTEATLFNPFSCEWEEDVSFVVKNGYVVGFGEYTAASTVSLRGKKVLPGLIDGHVHVESSLLTPVEYARAVLPRGTTTVVADPHEIANVAGTEGFRYMLEERRHTPLDILYMLPSCVPATPLETAGAELNADELASFVGEEGVLGLAEMMNVPGVLAGDEEVWKKLDLCALVDGHCPHLSGSALCAYLLGGIQSDHECTTLAEAREKLRRGMYVMIREGSTERNLSALTPLVRACSVSRVMFATDDRHVDMLVSEGHIDDCIRKAIDGGADAELVYRMATLSPAERFRLDDRGALGPGRLADFCIIDDHDGFQVISTYKRGFLWEDPGYSRRPPLAKPFCCSLPDMGALSLKGSGPARVIDIIEGQILTRSAIEEVEAKSVPDPSRDLLKVIVCDRYRGSGCGVGIVRGLGLMRGAIASSVAHDSHNIVAAGADDHSLLSAVRAVVAADGGMAVAEGDEVALLPLESGGLMSTLPYDEVATRLSEIESRARGLGAIAHPFMYLSFLSLTVIPELRITDRGLFDGNAFCDVPVFFGNSGQGR